VGIGTAGAEVSAARVGSSAAADELLSTIRGKRHRLAATVKAAVLELNRSPISSFPAARQEQARHELQALELALAALLAPAPEVMPTDRVERELRASARELAL
jgi:hypothetical protein